MELIFQKSIFIKHKYIKNLFLLKNIKKMTTKNDYENIKIKYFNNSLQKLGNIIFKLDNRLGLVSEFGQKYSTKVDLSSNPQQSSDSKTNTTKIPANVQENNDNKGKEKINIDTDKQKLTNESKNSNEQKQQSTETKKEPKENKKKENKQTNNPNENPEKDNNKETKEKKEKKETKKVQTELEKTVESYNDVDLRVGKVEKIIEMEGSDNLYHCWVNVGEENLREIGCGLRKYGISKEEFTKELIVVFANLKPKKLNNIMSNGMILSASKDDKFELIRPNKNSLPGDNVYLDIEGSVPRKVLGEHLSSNKFSKLMPLFKSNNEKLAAFSGIKLKTTSGNITVATLADSHIS